MKKSTSKVLVTIIILSLLVGIFFYFKISSGQGYIGNGQGSKNLTFTCPGNAGDRCFVQAGGICNVESGTANVIFRTSSLNYDGGWIVLDINSDGSLEGLLRTVSPVTGSYSVGQAISSSNGAILLPVKGAINKSIYYCPTNAAFGRCSSSNFLAGDFGVLRDFSYLAIYRAQTYAVDLSPSPSDATKETYSSFVYSCSGTMTYGNGANSGQPITTPSGSPLSVNFNSNTIATMPLTSLSKEIPAGTIVNFPYTIFYRLEKNQGSCGDPDCINSAGATRCLSDTSYFTCYTGTDGCYNKTIQTAAPNTVCSGNAIKLCNELRTDTCLTGTRASGEASCSFALTPNCCNDAHQCTLRVGSTSQCISNSCSYTSIPNWCQTSATCISPQACTTNQCVCPTTAEYCTAVGTEKCDSNKIYICQTTGACATWQVKQTCGETEICVS